MIHDAFTCPQILENKNAIQEKRIPYLKTTRWGGGNCRLL